VTPQERQREATVPGFACGGVQGGAGSQRACAGVREGWSFARAAGVSGSTARTSKPATAGSPTAARIAIVT
jgi:hypothetical protein